MVVNEKRTASRIPVNHHPVPLSIEDETITGRLVNLSNAGALFAFSGDERYQVEPALLGLDGSFKIKPKGRKTRLYTGEIVRFYVHNEQSFLALRFWKRPTELDE